MAQHRSYYTYIETENDTHFQRQWQELAAYVVRGCVVHLHYKTHAHTPDSCPHVRAGCTHNLLGFYRYRISLGLG